MMLTTSLLQSQTQKTIMTPQLRQSINILQLSHSELYDFLMESALDNPLIDIEYESAALYPTRKRTDSHSSGGIDTNSNQWRTLSEHLLEQLSYLSEYNATERRVAEYIIGNLNSWGYLEIGCDHISQALHVSNATVEKMLAVIQSFEPCGVGSRNLQECLKIQLASLNCEVDPLVKILIDNHLDDIANMHISRLAAALNTSPTRVQDALQSIRALFNPKPGTNFVCDEFEQYVRPDVIVTYSDGRYTAVLNESLYPNLSIDSNYLRFIRGRIHDKELSRYHEERYQAVLWIKKSVEQRKLTIARVAEQIVHRQQDFFRYGVEALCPLILKDIADELGIHESTVSRASQGKFIQTNNGVFEFKYFFSSRLQSNSGVEFSSKSIKNKIKMVIQRENCCNPFSDAELAQVLSQEGLVISRRTIAKYREEMRIPSSSKRKKYS